MKTDSAITVGEVQAHAETLAALASAILTGLANGKYDPEVAFTEKMLSGLGTVLPVAREVDTALHIAIALNKWTAPRGPIVSDRRGGMVPNTNSRVMPDGSLRPYDPAIDG
jgi:hypothetical protein